MRYLLLALVAGGCTVPNPDYQPFAILPSVDLAGGGDAAVADLARAPDFAVEVPDLLERPDLVAAGDLAAPADLAAPPDFAVEVDLLPPPDFACAGGCAIANGTGACVNGSCAIASCSYGFADCNGIVSDGCEVNDAVDVNNCGSCGHPCSTNHVTPQCQVISGETYCVGPCDPGWSDCNNDKRNDGCEANLQTDVNNCGCCGCNCAPTAFPHASCACSGGIFVLGACAAGWGNCDLMDWNGCETDLLTSNQNCGGCGINCVSRKSCTGGACQ